MEGYIKLWRRMLDSDEWGTMPDGQRCVLITLLLSANWKDRPGAVTLTERKLAGLARVDRRVVQRTLARLCKAGFLRREGQDRGQDQGQDRGQASPPYFIVKWEDYQECPGTTRANIRAQTGPGSGPVSIYEEERRKKGESARDPSATYQDEIRQLERNRQHAAPPQRHDDGYQQVVTCPECKHPMRLIRGRNGPYYQHPRMVGLGCQAKFNAADLDLVMRAAEERKSTPLHPCFCLGCSEHAIEGESYCESCKAIAREAGIL